MPSGGAGGSGVPWGAVSPGGVKERRMYAGWGAGNPGHGMLCPGGVPVFLRGKGSFEKVPDTVLPDSCVFGGEPSVYTGVCGYPAVLSGVGVGGEGVFGVVLFEGVLREGMGSVGKCKVRDNGVCFSLW